MSNPNREVRSITEEVRMVDVDGRQMIRGYAAVFDVPSQIMTTPGGRQFREVVKPGAFARSLQEADVVALFNHKPDLILGRRSAGTLRLLEDERGLVYEIDPADTSIARDLTVSLSRRDVSGSSFSFATIDDAWGNDESGMALRELRQAHLFDVGPVVFPAYLEATAAFRSLDSYEARAATEVPAPAADARVMVGLWLPTEIASTLAIKGGEPAESLHLTLCYLGRAIEIGTNAIDQVRQLCADAASYCPVLIGAISGFGRFSATETSDGQDVVYASVDIPGLSRFRERLASRLADYGVACSNAHGFTPHVTLSYLDPAAKTPITRIDPIQVTFPTLCLSVEGEKTLFNFGAYSEGYRSLAFTPTPDQVASLLRIRLAELS